MTTPDQLFASDVVADGEPAAPLSSWIRSIGLRLLVWIDTRADHWAAAAMYAQLSALSDAELARRGLSRATLAHDVRAMGDGIAERSA
jgi:hypothetical protein